MNFRMFFRTFVGVWSFAVAASNPIQQAEEGDDVVFQCLLVPEVDVSDSPLTWSKDERRNVVHVYIRGRDRADDQLEEFRNRTSLFHGGLSRGNVTLRLSPVRLTDSGTFTCFIQKQRRYCHTVLTVVKKGQLDRPRGTTSNTTSPLEDAAGGETTTVCGVKYLVVSIFLGVLGFLVLMIAGTYMFYRNIQQKREMKEAEGPSNGEMQTLRTQRRQQEERPPDAEASRTCSDGRPASSGSFI